MQTRLHRCNVLTNSSIIEIKKIILFFACQNIQDLKDTVFAPYRVQGVESLGGHFATFCQGFDLYEIYGTYYT